MSDKIELCANCGRPYREHVFNTWCFEGQEGRWFPGSIAEAIVASRQQAPQVIYGTKGEIPEDLRELYDRAVINDFLWTDMDDADISPTVLQELIERIARAEGSLLQAGFTKAADGFLWIPPVNEMAAKYYQLLNSFEQLTAERNAALRKYEEQRSNACEIFDAHKLLQEQHLEALRECERLKSYLNPIQLDHFELTKKE